MNKKTFTIVYVFGPKRCEQKYHDNMILDRNVGEWVKIGETSIDNDIAEITPELMRKAAVSRCIQESHTGIAELSCIYDTFIFPFRIKTDNVIRNILCNDIYSLENSYNASKSLGEGEIAPGREFVYGVCRNHIKHAVESFDHDLIVNASDEDLKMIRDLCVINNISIDAQEDEEETAVEGATGRKRTVNRNLDEVLQFGDVVKLTDRGRFDVLDEEGNAILATYQGGGKFLCKDMLEKCSPLAVKLINQFSNDKDGNPRHTVAENGKECWKYEVEPSVWKKLVELF